MSDRQRLGCLTVKVNGGVQVHVQVHVNVDVNLNLNLNATIQQPVGRQSGWMLP